MDGLLTTIGVAVVVFVATNVDDILLLAAFFADPGLGSRTVVVGQFIGIGTLVLVSTCLSLVALAVPEGYTSLLGVVPLALGLWKVREIWAPNEDGADQARDAEHRAESRTHSQLLAVAGVTIASGADNLGVYIPIFARDPEAIPVYAVAFMVLTAVWCAAGNLLVRSPGIGTHLRQYGHVLLPIVLVALGLWILAGARALFH